MATEAKVSIQIPEAEVRSHITAAVGEALSKNKDAFIKAVVHEALNVPQGPYSRATPLESAVKALIKDEAEAALKAWVVEHRGVIQTRVAAALAANDFANILAKAVTDSALSHIYADVKASVTLVREAEHED